jgi:hypothetical protein
MENLFLLRNSHSEQQHQTGAGASGKINHRNVDWE